MDLVSGSMFSFLEVLHGLFFFFFSNKAGDSVLPLPPPFGPKSYDVAPVAREHPDTLAPGSGSCQQPRPRQLMRTSTWACGSGSPGWLSAWALGKSLLLRTQQCFLKDVSCILSRSIKWFSRGRSSSRLKQKPHSFATENIAVDDGLVRVRARARLTHILDAFPEAECLGQAGSAFTSLTVATPLPERDFCSCERFSAYLTRSHQQERSQEFYQTFLCWVDSWQVVYCIVVLFCNFSHY